jgi:amino acid transporter
LTATLGIYVAVVPVTARILFAMGRDRALPRSLGTLNLRFQVPYNALTVVLVVSFVGAILMAFLQHSYFNALVWFGELAVFVALVTFIAVNVSNIFFYRRFRLWKFNLIWNLLVPIVGIGINLYILWRSFFCSPVECGLCPRSECCSLRFALVYRCVCLCRDTPCTNARPLSETKLHPT